MGKVKGFFTNKRFIYGTGSAATLAGFIAIAVLVNIIIGTLSDKFTLKADLTENKIYDLTEQTTDIVKAIDENVDIILFEKTGSEDPLKHELLQRYVNLNSKLTLKVYDPVKDPTTAQKYQTPGQTIGSGTVVVDNGKNHRVISSADFYSYSAISGKNDQFNAENKITTALMSLSRRDDIKVAFTQGHGEESISAAESLLTEDGITVEKVATLSEGFSEEYDMFMIVAPKTDFTAAEIDAVDEYLKKGKNIQVYMHYNAPPLPRLESYLSDMGIAVKKDIIFEGDAKKIAYNTPLCFIPEVISHPITSSIINSNLNVLVYGSRVIQPLWEEKNSTKVETLLKSSEKSVAADEAGQKTTGPFSVALIATRSDNTGKIFVMGSTDFLNGEFTAVNKDFILGSVNWQIENIKPMNIRPKSLSSSRLDMTRQDIIIWAIVVSIFIPVIVLAAGLVMWLRRRHL